MTLCNNIRGIDTVSPFIEVQFRQVAALALVDTGSTHNFISRALVDALKRKHIPFKLREKSTRCVLPNSTFLQSLESTKLYCRMGQLTWNTEFHVIDNLVVDVILGNEFMARSGMIIDFCHQIVTFKFDRGYRFPFAKTPPLSIFSFSSDTVGGSDPTHSQCLDALKLEFQDVLTPVLGCVKDGICHIDLKDDIPVRTPAYQCSPPRLKALRNIINDLLAKGVIKPSTSNYASPAFLVPKGRPNDYRMVVNYQKLNQKVVFDSYPVPAIENAFLHFQGAKYFSVLDLNSAYYQVPLSEESARAAAFVTPFGLFQPCRTPMGLSIGSQVLSRLLDRILGDLKYEYVYNYIDDVLVFSSNWSDHLRHLREVFTRLRNAGLTVNPDKVSLGVTEIKFLGHIISGSGIRVNPERIQGIVDCRPPTDLKGVRRYLGLAGYFCRHIPNFSRLAAPLNQLKRKGVHFVWGEEQQSAFEGIQRALSEAPTLQIPDFSKEFYLYTDASDIALAAVLKQKVDGHLAPVAYASRVLTNAERVYSIYERECLAVVFGCERFKQLLEHTEFTVFTDNQALSWMRRHVNQLGRIGRWILRLSPFKFKVVHVRGSENQVADCLSRMFDPGTEHGPVLCAVLPSVPASYTSICEHQKQDPLCRDIYLKLSQGEVVPNFRLSRDLIVYRPSKQCKNKVLLPKTLVPMILEYFHDSPFGGHLGQRKTYLKISRQFYWSSLRKDVTNYVRACESCLRSKPARTLKVGLLSSEVVTSPCDVFFIDFFGPLVRSRLGNTAILSVIDGFSKFIWLFPVRNMTAKVVCEIMTTRVMSGFGVPRCIVSDNGAQFRSDLFHEMCFKWGTKHVRTSPHNPCPNQVERVHRNLKIALQIFHHDNQRSWDTNLHVLALAFNTGVHESTGTTAGKLFLGRELSHPLEVKWDLTACLADGCPQEDINQIWAAALASLKKAHQNVARRYNANRVEVPFKLGDRVVCKIFPKSSAAHHFTAKLAFHWSTPLIIARFSSPVSVMLSDPSTGIVVRSAHVRHIKRLA